MKSPTNRSESADWPELPYKDGSDTAATLHMWTQVVGKIRLAWTPWTHHSWHVPLYVTARGLGTSLIPCDGRAFEIDFDFLAHQLVIRSADGAQRQVRLEPRPLSDFYREVIDSLTSLDLHVEIHTTPSEVANGIPFEKDTEHHHYDRDFAIRFWRALVQIDRVFKEFRSRFVGKCSPVLVAREAYSHEVSSAGFWPGGGGVESPASVSYAYPAPAGFPKARVSPSGAYYSSDLGEFVLAYDAVREAASPDDALLEFLQSTYEAAADEADWDREALERDLVPAGGSAA